MWGGGAGCGVAWAVVKLGCVQCVGAFGGSWLLIGCRRGCRPGSNKRQLVGMYAKVAVTRN